MATPAARDDRRKYSIAHLLLLAPWIALVIDAWAPIGDNSFLWHVRAGSIQLDAGSVLTADPFSFTKGGEAWLTQSWLAELLYGRLEAATELGFVPWMLLTLSSLAFLGVGLIAYRANRNILSTALVLLLVTVSLVSFLVPRPVIFSFLLFVLVILAWEEPRYRWSIPFLFWIWASVHGSFAVGLVYVALRVAGRREWRSWPFVLAGGLATLLTAHGLGVFAMLFDFLEARPYLFLLTEWRPPELLSAVFLPVFVGLALILVGAVKGNLRMSHLWIVIPFLALALTATRSVPPALLALVIPISVAFGTTGAELPRRFSIGSALVFGVVVLVLPVFLRGDGRIAEDRFPMAVSESLTDVPAFHDDVVGGYLIWAQGPELEIFIDDRAELYQDQIERFVAVRSGREPWRPLFDEYEIGQALLRADEPMVRWLEGAGWIGVAADEEFALLGAPAG